MIRIYPSSLEGRLKSIPSKSLSHRYLIAASLAKGTSEIHDLLTADDIEATKKALASFGVIIQGRTVFGGELSVLNQDINCHESGTTLRFIIPFSLLFHEAITIRGEGRLPLRPLTPYEEVFKHKAVKYEKLSDLHLPIRVRGRIKGGYMKIQGNISSQFISGLLLISPVLKQDTVIEIEGPFESKPYVDLTLEVMRQFGIDVIEVLPYYYIKGSQTYQPGVYRIEGDYSQAAFFLAAGVLTHRIQITGLHPESRQGDRKILEILNDMNGIVHVKDDLIESSKSQLVATRIDLSQIPDLGPILFVLAAKAKGKTRFTQYQRLRLKESDRIDAMKEAFDQLGISMVIHENWIEIEGQKTIQGGQTINTHGDHRIFMALSILATTTEEGLILTDETSIQKSYPGFLEDLKQLGGHYDILK